jgi:nitrate reductase delta subunit
VVLEFSAQADPGAAARLLKAHRAGLELLWRALREAGSPYAGVIEAVRATLPDPAPRDLAEALRLAQEGPPAERVGLEPFGPSLDRQEGRP